jgi:hypothetical protein
MTVFWNVAPCCLVKLTYVSEAHAASIIIAMGCPDDGGSKDL